MMVEAAVAALVLLVTVLILITITKLAPILRASGAEPASETPQEVAEVIEAALSGR